MELQQISEKSYIVDTVSPMLTSTTLIHCLGEGEIVLVDTGCTTSEELFQEFDRRGWHVCAAICTHMHWDHVANNEQIVKRGGKIYAHEKEDRGGHFARFSVTYPISYVSAGNLEIHGENFGLIHAPGHTPGHCAVLTPDRILHMGDALMGKSELSISKLPYMEDVQTALTSMVMLKRNACSAYVVSHNGIVYPKDIEELIDANIKKEIDIYNSIRAFVARPMKIEDFSESFMRSLNITNRLILKNTEMRKNAERRLEELIRADELESDGVMVFPKH